MSARRGEVWLVDFNPVVGHEQAGRRPALVLSDDQFNASPAGLVAVLPITSKPRNGLVTRVHIRPPEGGLSMDSWVIGEQTRTVSSNRLDRRLGTVLPVTMQRVEDIVRMILGL